MRVYVEDAMDNLVDIGSRIPTRSDSRRAAAVPCPENDSPVAVDTYDISVPVRLP